MKRHIKVFHPETLAETVHEFKTECEESDNIAMALSVQEEASSDVEEEKIQETETFVLFPVRRKVTIETLP